MTPYPWHSDAWRKICGDSVAGRMPHALLLGGRAGTGKRRFAESLSGYLLCTDRLADTACGNCRSCRLFQAGSHPDLIIISPNPDATVISVDEIRDSLELIGLTRQYGNYKIIIIQPAEAMNRNASNALLKTLEEPTAGTIFILVSDQPASLLPTIRSRCQHIALDPVNREQAIFWLQRQKPEHQQLELALALARQAPLVAAELDVDNMRDQISTVIEQFTRLLGNGRNVFATSDHLLMQYGLTRLLDALVHLTEMMVYKKTDCVGDLLIDQFSDEKTIETLLGEVEVRALFEFYDRLLRVQRIFTGRISLRERDLADEILFEWTSMAGRSTH